MRGVLRTDATQPQSLLKLQKAAVNTLAVFGTFTEETAMKFLSFGLIAGAAALAIGGVATVAVANGQPVTHEIAVNLPDGAVERIQYTGDTPPEVVLAQAPKPWPWAAPVDVWVPPSFAALERISEDVDRQMDALFHENAALLSKWPTLIDTSIANVPPGTTSMTWVSTSNGGQFCSRITQVTAPASGGSPEVVSRQSGNCDWEPAGTHNPAVAPAEQDRGVIEAGLRVHKTNDAHSSAL